MTSHDTTHLPLALATGFAAGLALAFGATVRRPGRESMQESDRHAALAAYLHEHLSGSDAAIRVVERLRRTQTEDQPLFDWLYDEFQAERQIVRAILARLGASPVSPKRVLAHVPASVLERLAGGRAGDLSLFRALEALAIGVQGKRCMWRALQSLRPAPHPRGTRSLADLEAAAVRQWEVIERRRTGVAPQTFATGPGTRA